jgi:hypothetical protein
MSYVHLSTDSIHFTFPYPHPSPPSFTIQFQFTITIHLTFTSLAKKLTKNPKNPFFENRERVHRKTRHAHASQVIIIASVSLVLGWGIINLSSKIPSLELDFCTTW